MKAVKTKSGKWQCRPVDHYETVNGKRKVVLACVTAETKKRALELAYAYERDRKRAEPLTFADALQKYIDLKRNVLSVTTIARGYESIQRNAYGQINGITLDSFTSEIVQAWLNDYSSNHSPKSVANAHGLLMAVFSMFRPNMRFNVTLPQRKKPDLYTPTDSDIKRLIEAITGTEMEKAVLLSAFGTLRRGELCALTLADVHGDAITVSKSLVKNGAGEWLLKSPKTADSVRTVKYPPEVIKRVVRDCAPSGRLLQLTPDQITRRFPKLLEECGLPPFRFHDLRAYAASIRHAIGIPDQYIMNEGGWKTDAVLKDVYRRTMQDKNNQFQEKANAHFSELLAEKTVTKTVTIFPNNRILFRKLVNSYVIS